MTTIAPRVFLSHFALANPLYAEARLYAYVADVSTGRATTTLATLYRAPTGTEEEANPFRLDGDGKLTRPVYVDGPVVVRAHPVGSTPVHDTGVLGLISRFRGEWEASTLYQAGDTVRDGRAGDNTNRVYIAIVWHTSSGNFSDELAAGKWLLYVDASTPVDYDDTIVSVATGFFFENDGARVHRLTDRLFIGVSTANDGSTLGGGAGADWFSAGTGVAAGLPWVTYLSTVAVVSPNGTIGISAASRASDVPDDLGTSQISIPFVGIAIMDRAGIGPPYWTSYGAYLEARIEAASAMIGTTIGMEIDAINFGGAVADSTPWRRQTTGGATALWLASGGDPANHGRAINPAQLALGIVNNGETFMAGIVMANDAIEGTDGSTGFGQAISLSTRHLFSWYGPGSGNGERVNYIVSTATVPGHSLQFQDGGSFFASSGGTIDFNVANVASSVNGISVLPAVSGQTAAVMAIGPAANLDIAIKPQGTGLIQLRCEAALFYSDDGYQMAGIVSNVTDTSVLPTLQFADTGAFIYHDGSIVVDFAGASSADRHLEVSNATAGNPVGLRAVGTGDTDIVLDPGGTNGTLRLAVPTATSATIGGASALPGVPATYFIVKDGAGTSFKIPAWNS